MQAMQVMKFYSLESIEVKSLKLQKLKPTIKQTHFLPFLIIPFLCKKGYNELYTQLYTQTSTRTNFMPMSILFVTHTENMRIYCSFHIKLSST